MSRVRRVKPSTVAGRKRQAELGQIISSPRTSKEDSAAALEELNLLAPIVGTSLSENGSHPAPTAEDSRVPSAPVVGLRSAIELDRTRVNLTPLLSTRTITPETTAFAIEAVTFTLNLFGKKFSDLSPVQQLGMIRFQFDVWAGTKPSAETLVVVDEVHGTGHLK